MTSGPGTGCCSKYSFNEYFVEVFLKCSLQTFAFVIYTDFCGIHSDLSEHL